MRYLIWCFFLLLGSLGCDVNRLIVQEIDCSRVLVDSLELELEYYEIQDTVLLGILDSCLARYQNNEVFCKTCVPSFMTMHLYEKKGVQSLKINVTSSYLLNFYEAGYGDTFNIYPMLGVTYHNGVLIKLSGNYDALGKVKILRKVSNLKKVMIFVTTQDHVPYINTTCDFNRYFIWDGELGVFSHSRNDD